MEEERQTEISKDLLDLGVWSQNPAMGGFTQGARSSGS